LDGGYVGLGVGGGDGDCVSCWYFVGEVGVGVGGDWLVDFGG